MRQQRGGGGYSTEEILKRVSDSIQKVRRGEAVFERDGVAFYHEEYRFGLLAALFYVALHEHKLNILDFGGSLGSSYFQNRKLLAGIPTNWNVVEQEMFVDYGRQNVPELNFFYKLADLRNKKINCLIASSTLAYVDEPFEYLDEVLKIHAKYLIIDRMPFNFEPRDRIAIQHVPASIYKAIYPVYLLHFEKFLNIILQQYDFILNLPQNESMTFLDVNGFKRVNYFGALFRHK